LWSGLCHSQRAALARGSDFAVARAVCTSAKRPHDAVIVGSTRGARVSDILAAQLELAEVLSRWTAYIHSVTVVVGFAGRTEVAHLAAPRRLNVAVYIVVGTAAQGPVHAVFITGAEVSGLAQRLAAGFELAELLPGRATQQLEVLAALVEPGGDIARLPLGLVPDPIAFAATAVTALLRPGCLRVASEDRPRGDNPQDCTTDFVHADESAMRQ
jgi:hypothetical protein